MILSSNVFAGTIPTKTQKGCKQRVIVVRVKHAYRARRGSAHRSHPSKLPNPSWSLLSIALVLPTSRGRNTIIANGRGRLSSFLYSCSHRVGGGISFSHLQRAKDGACASVSIPHSCLLLVLRENVSLKLIEVCCDWPAVSSARPRGSRG